MSLARAELGRCIFRLERGNPPPCLCLTVGSRVWGAPSPGTAWILAAPCKGLASVGVGGLSSSPAICRGLGQLLLQRLLPDGGRLVLGSCPVCRASSCNPLPSGMVGPLHAGVRGHQTPAVCTPRCSAACPVMSSAHAGAQHLSTLDPASELHAALVHASPGLCPGKASGVWTLTRSP